MGIEVRPSRVGLGASLAVAVAVCSWWLQRTGADAGEARELAAPLERGEDTRPARRMIAGTAASVWSISGLVEGTGGASLAGASVCAVAAGESCCSVQQCTDADGLGRFSFVGLSGRGYAVVASARGYLAQTETVLAPDAGDSRRRDIVLRLDPGGVALSGVVIDVTGGSVSGAVISARAGDGVISAATSDAAGNFQLSAEREGPLRLHVEAEAYAPLQVEASVPAAGLTLSLVPGSTLRGRVVENDDEAVAGVVVTATNVDGLRSREILARSAEDGSFELSGLPAGRYALDAVAPEWRGERAWVSVGVGESSAPITMKVRPATTLSGTVQIDGEPCPSAYLELAGPVVSYQRAESDGTIRAEGLLPGQYHVTAGCLDTEHQPTSEDLLLGSAPVHRSWSLNSLAEAEAEAELDAPCCEPSGVIQAVIVAEEASLLGSLVARVASGSDGRRHATPRGRREGDSFVFEKLALGHYEVFLEQSPETRQAVSLERDGQVLEVRLEAPRSAEIAGRVLDDRGEPIVDAWVRASRGADGRGETAHAPVLTDAEGAFKVAGLFPGQYALLVESGAGRARLDAVAAGTAGVVLRVTPHGTLSGTVRTAAGDAEEFSLLYRRQGDTEVRKTRGVGSWRLPFIPVGVYQLVAISPSGFASEEVALHGAGDALEVGLTLRPTREEDLPEWARQYPRRDISAR